MKFTDKFIQSLKATDKIQDIREGKGFGIRVTPGGVKTWFFIYRFDGKRRFMNLGHYPSVTLTEAGKRYRAAFDLYEQGHDPLALSDQAQDERRKAPTVADLVTEYIERYAKKFKRSWAKDEQILNRDVVPVWGKRKAKDITKRDVNLLMEGIVDRGAPIMANYCFAILRKMYNWSIEQGILETTPFLGTKLPSLTNERKRALNEAEIKTFWDSLDRTDLNMSDNVRRCLKLILLTGQRPNEVSGIHADEIDGCWWTIPVKRQKVSKSKEDKREPHRVYLTPTALTLIGDTTGKGYLFPTPLRDADKPLGETALAVAVGRNLAYPLTDKEGNPLFNKDGKPATENRLGVDHFTPHDLRRTAATGMGGLHIMDEVIDAVLCHVKKGIIGTYNRHGYDAEKQAALIAWENKIKIILAGDKVVDLGAERDKRKTA